ncbi:hypothetical protein N7G274_008220 [Stereocaulon virgatum]|uniref:Uncharacterized protein n=1 Tax=Stereocaulon virgatum TaxID=373712 RepID=A0ABR4A2M8_9LECA
MYYLSDRYVTALGCADQHQLCNRGNGNCTPLTGWNLARAYVRQLTFNDAQLDTAIRIVGAAEFVDSYSSVRSRGASALRASETVDDHSSQIQLPSTQWMTEVSSWFAVSMAKLQQRIVQYATGPAYIPQGSSLVGPLNKHQEKMCKNQKVRSRSGTTSFSVLGVAIILIIGSVLILASLLPDTVVGIFRRQLHWKDYKSLQWTLDDKLQMQRMAHEEAGQGHWTGGASSYPLTRTGDKLGVPEGVDSVHPLLSKTRRQYSDGENGAPEAEGLMTVKGVRFHVRPVQI